MNSSLKSLTTSLVAMQRVVIIEPHHHFKGLEGVITGEYYSIILEENFYFVKLNEKVYTGMSLHNPEYDIRDSPLDKPIFSNISLVKKTGVQWI